METIYGKNLTEEVVEAEDKKQKDPFISMAHDLQYEKTEAFSHDKEESENGERSCSNVMPSKILKNSASKGRQRKAFKRSNVERKSGKTTLAEEMKKMAKLCQKGRDGKPDIYELPKLPELHHENGAVVKYYIGPVRPGTDSECRVLLVVGKTGAVNCNNKEHQKLKKQSCDK
ncbi:unnamed protein product [Darwinula stevensoni]|uniref:Uncharacterized protein n=1 Tax=Darwinula stevensoni TaxID=69355 RepID=A0A7R9AHJ6_9CRUS|nr:unnamed protein product [Darwinula stevensoni]CAG0904464.1 unnamed protein product [Darwinula stevensoni]